MTSATSHLARTRAGQSGKYFLFTTFRRLNKTDTFFLSLRIPAAHCGVFGFRPTHGAVSATGVIKFAKSLDTVGWFARDASVLQQVGDVLLQPRLGNRGGPEGAHQELPKKLFVLEDVIDLCDTKAQCGVAAVCSALETEFPHGTISRLDLGQHLLLLCPTLREVQTRDGGSGLDALRVCLANIMGREVWQALGTWYAARPFSEDGDTGPGVRERMQLASKITEEQFTICTKARAEVKVALGVLLDGDSDAALVFPTAPSAAPFLESDETTQTAWRKKTLAVTSICSLTGFPQVTVPLTDDNPNDGPRGVSLVMGPGRDYALLRAARAFSEKVRIRAFQNPETLFAHTRLTLFLTKRSSPRTRKSCAPRRNGRQSSATRNALVFLQVPHLVRLQVPHLTPNVRLQGATHSASR